MIIQRLKKYWISLISVICISVISILACGGYDMDAGYWSMFAPEVISNKSVHPFFRTTETPFYDGYNNESFNDSISSINTREWETFFEKQVSKESINYWLYKSTVNQVDSMIYAIRGEQAILSSESQQNTLINVKPVSKSKYFLFLVGFAMRNEKFAVINDFEWDKLKQKQMERVTLEKQIQGGENLYKQCKDAFLKERYGFQMARLYFFQADYDKVVSFCNQILPSIKLSESIKWRVLGYKAAALYKKQNYAEANYIYSLIYDKFPAMKKTAYFSFHPQEESDWNKSLALATNNHEKAVLWQLLGIYHDPLRAMKEIAKLEPNSELMDLLMVRAVNLEEENLYGSGYNEAKHEELDKKLISFMHEQCKDKKIKELKPWLVASAYLSYLAKDWSAGDQAINEAKKINSKGKLITAQTSVIALYGKLQRTTEITDAVEKEILADAKALFAKENPSALRTILAQNWFRKKLSDLYKAKGETEKAEIVSPEATTMKQDRIEFCKKMIKYYDRSQNSPMEEFLKSIASLSKNDYVEYLAIEFALKNDLESAVATFKSSKGAGKKELLGNPFIIHINDCHDCDHAAKQKTKYTKLSFCERLLELKNQVKTNPSANAYLQLANGFYNATWYGNARVFYENSVASDHEFSDAYENVPMVDDCSVAKGYYEEASKTSKDKEFKAMCTFMIAKCEQNEFFNHPPDGYVGDFKSGNAFKSLKSEYSDTKYYKEALQECGYFRTFAGN